MPALAADPPPGPRVGGVIYLNSRPLIEGLRADLDRRGRLTLDHPSRLADGLKRGAYDAALVPSIAALGTAGATILSDACVAARGPVRSVKLFFRVPPGEVRSLALDEGSRTSAALSRVLLAERFGVQPELRPLPVGPGPSPRAAAEAIAATDADAVLLIGDRAMVDPPDRRTGRPFAAVWDLGQVWNEWTGLPFVFAAWAARPGLGKDAAADLARRFSASRDEGVRDLDRIAALAGPPLGLTPEDAADYLRRNLHFTLGPAERAGLNLYCELCVRNGLLPEGARPTYAAPPPPRSVRLTAPPTARAATPEPLRVTR
ncbi:menaquinone biosynthetic enzyme MqnA/MqnD family protein [Alienimonas californiensis]|uniref:Chorismate dehydratase n=1 Tax=Alienimonas californiensis TaxID=2527989 RepID=A0A517PDM7_9PLAN|nr:menaquinone biosynthesis protein [Alienimonas californiensis]QDT17482.1 Chorismate dehydratase [Alienimonas californiensis]